VLAWTNWPVRGAPDAGDALAGLHEKPGGCQSTKAIRSEYFDEVLAVIFDEEISQELDHGAMLDVLVRCYKSSKDSAKGLSVGYVVLLTKRERSKHAADSP